MCFRIGVGGAEVKSAEMKTTTPITLREAFDEAYASSHCGMVKTLRAIADLMAWSTDQGNEAPDGFLIYGLSRAIDKCADELSTARVFPVTERRSEG